MGIILAMCPPLVYVVLKDKRATEEKQLQKALLLEVMEETGGYRFR